MIFVESVSHSGRFPLAADDLNHYYANPNPTYCGSLEGTFQDAIKCYDHDSFTNDHKYLSIKHLCEFRLTQRPGI
jgi:hypothetical protein